MRALCLALMAVLVAPMGASADDMDITLARLRVATRDAAGMQVPAANLPLGCNHNGDNGLPRAFCPDTEQWERLISQLGGSMIPPVMSPARTVGYGGFYVGVEGWLTVIDADADYWKLGTEGSSSAGDEMCMTSRDTGLGCNRFPSDALIWWRVSARKGFPFGFELGTHFSQMLQSNIWAWGLEIKWALWEGYRTGIGILPDVAIRGMVNTLVGDTEFNLTVPSIDLVISKPFAIAGTGTITPFISGGVAFVFGDSELVDLTPDVDAFTECAPDPQATMTSCTGAAAPMGGRAAGEDYNNNATFPKIRATRQRLAFGVQGRYEAITLTGSFAFDLTEPGTSDDVPDDMGRQFQVNAGVGLTF